MLRLVVLVLLALNLGYYAWGQGWLLVYGWGPAQQREPQRMAQQVHPEAVTLLSNKEMAAAEQPVASEQSPAAPQVATVCWQTADLDAQRAEALRPLLKARFPDNAWVFDETRLPARWMVYMGKYTQPEDLAKKREQLNRLKVSFSVLNNTAFSPGLSLGVFTSEEAANTALQEVTQRGVRSARVVQERSDVLTYRLRLPAVSSADQAALDAIKAALPGKTLDVCPVVAPAAVTPASR